MTLLRVSPEKFLRFTTTGTIAPCVCAPTGDTKDSIPALYIGIPLTLTVSGTTLEGHPEGEGKITPEFSVFGFC